MVTLPRLVIAAPSSGQGKTTVAMGLMAALTQAGQVVAPAKVGPDYIDPGYHALATGRPGRNLDPWLCGADLMAPLLAHAAQTPTPADVAIIEGVMGLYDGRLGTDGEASTAHVAALTRTPVLLVLDIASASRTVAAVVQGLAHYAGPQVGSDRAHIAGVVLNRAGSQRHADEVRRAIEQVGVPVVGVLHRDSNLSVPSRHLGLVTSAEQHDAHALVQKLGERISEGCDLDAIRQLAESAPSLAATPWSPESAIEVSEQHTRPRVAVAGGAAFTFAYAETGELLRAAGCEPVAFDPIHDARLPTDTAGLLIGGGFPEEHAQSLAANSGLREDIAERVAAGMPTVAECAGLTYLCRSLEGHAMVGAIPAEARMSQRLTMGYRVATMARTSVLGEAGKTVTGHEFHRTVLSPTDGHDAAWLVGRPEPSPSRNPEGIALDPAGTGRASLHASYLHTHWAGHPWLAAEFAQAVRAFADRRGMTEQSPPDLHHHGDRETGPGLLNFAVNVRGQHPPDWLAQELRESVVDLAAYPNSERACAALAAHHEVPIEAVLPTNGAAEAFTLIAQALPGANPVVVHPQFTEPEAALQTAGRHPSRHLLSAPDFGLDAHALEAEHPHADLVVLGNPTNPTGVLHRSDQVQALRKAGRTLVVDEAFMDIIAGEPGSMICAGSDLTGVLVIRSMTKTWALAGLRAGYVVGDPALIAQLRHHQPPWSVSTLALRALTALTQRADPSQTQRDTVEWRAHLEAGLRALGLHPVAGQTPFVLVRAGAGTHAGLRERGVAVRRCDTFPGLSADWIRIAVRDQRATDTLLAELKEVLPG